MVITAKESVSYSFLVKYLLWELNIDKEKQVYNILVNMQVYFV